MKINPEKFKEDLNMLLKKYGIKEDNLREINISFSYQGMVIIPRYKVENGK